MIFALLCFVFVDLLHLWIFSFAHPCDVLFAPLQLFSLTFGLWDYAELTRCPVKGKHKIKGVVVVDAYTQYVFDSVFDSF